MYVTPHALAGATTAVTLSSAGAPPWVALGASFASHAVLDMIPHHDYQQVLPGLVDVTTATAVTWLYGHFFGVYLGYIWLWGAIAGAIPDVEVLIKYFFPQLKWPLLYPSHSGLLPHPQIPFRYGFLTQVLGVAVVLALTMQNYVKMI